MQTGLLGQSNKVFAIILHPLVAVFVVVIILTVRMFRILNRYAVNVFFWDEWDFRTPQLYKESFWSLFWYQHGPHRQGIGFVVDTIINGFTAYDSRIESILLGATTAIAMLAALWLKQRLTGSISYSDVVIPLIFLVTAQFPAFLHTPNLSHGPFPLLLVIVYCVAWTVENLLAKHVLLLLLNFFLIFTGFGFFVGLITPCLLGVEFYHAFRRDSALRSTIVATSWVISILSLASFFIGYKVQDASGCLQLPFEQPLRYLQYAGLMLLNFLSFNDSARPVRVGLYLFVAMLSLCVKSTYMYMQHRDNTSRAFTILTGFSLLFCVHTAIGRLCLGIETAASPRYVPYLIPGFFGVYLYFLSLKQVWVRALATISFGLVLSLWTVPMASQHRALIRSTHDGKSRWRTCYLTREDIEECDKLTKFKIYPFPEATRLSEKLALLKIKKLNIYKGD